MVCIGALVLLASVCNVYLSDGLYVPDSTRHGSLIGLAFDGCGGANLQVPGPFTSPLVRGAPERQETIGMGTGRKKSRTLSRPGLLL